MEWAVVAAFALIAALAIGLAREPRNEVAPDIELLREQRRPLRDELRDLDEDAEAGRISPEDRQAGRRALAPRLRAATEALREAGEERTTALALSEQRDAEAR